MNSPETLPTVEEVKQAILEFCVLPRRKDDILQGIGIEITPYNYKKYIIRLFEDRYLNYTVPGRPRSSIQQYIISKKGLAYLKALE